MVTLLVLRHILHIAFFIFIGMWWVALLPVLVGIFLFLYTTSEGYTHEFSLETARNAFEKYALVIARSMMMFGVRGLVDIFGAQEVTVGLSLILINILLWIGSYVVGYKDGKHMFHLGYYISSIALLWHVSHFFSRGGLFELIMGWIAFTMAIYAFIVFVMGALDVKVDRTLHYPLFITANLSLIFLVYWYTKEELVISVVLSQVYLLGLYSCIRRINKTFGLEGVTFTEEDDDVLRRILSGKSLEIRRSQALRIEQIDVFKDLYRFLQTLTPTTKGIISSLNIILIFLQVLFFVNQLGGSFSWMTEAYFWFGIVVFFVNFLLLRQINWYHEIQRILAFVLINFGIYISIIDIFGQDPVYLVSIGIIWSILNALLVFQSEYFHMKGFLEKQDYLYRIGANLLATICNVYFVFLLPLSLQIRFSFAFVYVSIQLFLTYYNLKFLTK